VPRGDIFVKLTNLTFLESISSKGTLHIRISRMVVVFHYYNNGQLFLFRVIFS
jgi:hypothetical protein